MKKIVFISVAFATMTLTTACMKGSQSTSHTIPNKQTSANVRSIDELLSKAKLYINQTITISGLCTHTCKHGATKIFLMGSSDAQTLRIEAGTLGSFDTKCLHHPVQVTGILREERIDEGYLLRWEEKLKQEKERTEDAGCQTEKNARGETAHTAEKRIADFRQRIAQRQKSEGKSYLSFYFMEATAYEIQP